MDYIIDVWLFQTSALSLSGCLRKVRLFKDDDQKIVEEEEEEKGEEEEEAVGANEEQNKSSVLLRCAFGIE